MRKIKCKLAQKCCTYILLYRFVANLCWLCLLKGFEKQLTFDKNMHVTLYRSASFIELQCVCDFSACFCKLLSLSACVCRYGLCVCTFHRYPHHQHCVHANLQRRNEEQATCLSSSDPAGFCVWGDVGRCYHQLVCCQRRVVATDQLPYHHLGENFSALGANCCPAKITDAA